MILNSPFSPETQKLIESLEAKGDDLQAMVKTMRTKPSSQEIFRSNCLKKRSIKGSTEDCNGQNYKLADELCSRRLNKEEKMKDALIIVDMLEDFCNPSEALYVPGAEQIVESICQLKQLFLEEENYVVYANDSHLENDDEFRQFPPHCIQGSYGASTIVELTPSDHPYETVFLKDTFDAFSNPELLDFLKDKRVANVYIVGVATDYCIHATALSAIEEGFSTTVITDAIAGVGRIPDVPDTNGYLETCLMEMGLEGIDWCKSRDMRE